MLGRPAKYFQLFHISFALWKNPRFFQNRLVAHLFPNTSRVWWAGWNLKKTPLSDENSWKHYSDTTSLKAAWNSGESLRNFRTHHVWVCDYPIPFQGLINGRHSLAGARWLTGCSRPHGNLFAMHLCPSTRQQRRVNAQFRGGGIQQDRHCLWSHVYMHACIALVCERQLAIFMSHIYQLPCAVHQETRGID